MIAHRSGRTHDPATRIRKAVRRITSLEGYIDYAEEGPCILTYGPADIAGLGHLRRNTNIALRFASETLTGNALVIGAWPTGLPSQDAPGVDFIKLPSVQRTEGRTWRPSSLRIDLRRLLDIRSSIIVSILESLQPDVFLVDYLPVGYCGELQAALHLLKRRSSRTKMVLGLRDILDSPDVIRHTWERDGIYDVLEQYYNLILIYGDPTVFDAAAEYGLNRLRRPEVRYCGYVGSDDLLKAGPGLPNKSASSNTTRLLIVGGGGFDAYPMMSRCIDAVDLLRADCNLDGALITGPLMTPADRQSLERKATGLPIAVIPYVDNPLDYIAGADLVIGMAGYNTVVETIGLGKKMIAIPRSGPSAEQSMRANFFSAKGYLTTRCLEECSPSSLAESIRQGLEPTDSGRPQPDLNGLAKVVDELLKTCYRFTAVQPLGAR